MPVTPSLEQSRIPATPTKTTRAPLRIISQDQSPASDIRIVVNPSPKDEGPFPEHFDTRFPSVHAQEDCHHEVAGERAPCLLEEALEACLQMPGAWPVSALQEDVPTPSTISNKGNKITGRVGVRISLSSLSTTREARSAPQHTQLDVISLWEIVSSNIVEWLKIDRRCARMADSTGHQCLNSVSLAKICLSSLLDAWEMQTESNGITNALRHISNIVDVRSCYSHQTYKLRRRMPHLQRSEKSPQRANKALRSWLTDVAAELQIPAGVLTNHSLPTAHTGPRALVVREDGSTAWAPNFAPYELPQAVRYLSLVTHLLTVLQRPLCKLDRGSGSVYVLHKQYSLRSGLRSFVKIGSSKEDDADRRVRSLRSRCKLDEWDANSNEGDPPPFRPSRYAKRLEDLVHTVLRSERRILENCLCPKLARSRNKTQHQEWFELAEENPNAGLARVLRVLDYWRDWLNAEDRYETEEPWTLKSCPDETLVAHCLRGLRGTAG
jgi:hypothetical protein